jgi:hypothetical protein
VERAGIRRRLQEAIGTHYAEDVEAQLAAGGERGFVRRGLRDSSRRCRKQDQNGPAGEK